MCEIECCHFFRPSLAFTFFQGRHELLTGIGFPILFVLFESGLASISPAWDVWFSYSSWNIFIGLGDDKFAKALVVFTPRWYAIDTFSDAFCKLRPVCFPEIPARFLLRRDCWYVQADRDNAGSVLAVREMWSNGAWITGHRHCRFLCIPTRCCGC